MRKCFTCLAFLLAFPCLSWLYAQEVHPVDSTAKGADTIVGTPFRFFTNASFITVIGQLSLRATEEAMVEKVNPHVLYDQYFREFAREHNISAEQVRTLMNSWVQGNTVKEDETDAMLQGARHFYLKQYHTSSLYYEQAVEQQEAARSAQAGPYQQASALTEEAEALYPAFILAGNSSIASGNYKRAIRMYHNADSLLLLPAATEKTYAAIYKKKNYLYTLLAATLVEAGSQLGGKEGYDLLTAATLVEKTLLTNYYKPTTSPQEWAKTQSQLGTIWHLQGDMDTATASGDSLYMLSIEAYNDALSVYTQKDFPVDWARMQHNLGVVLSKLGAIKEATASFRSAMGIFTLEKNPRDWASTAYHLGNMLQCQAGKAKDAEATELFTQSVKAYRQALEVYTDKTTPEEWGWAQHNLGVSLFEQGRRLGERDLLSQAATAFRQALTIQTKDCFPAAWASVQYNLGTALWEESSRAAGGNVTLLADAATAYESALGFYTPKDHPEQWFNVQNGLGLLYEQQKEWTAAIQHFENIRDMEPMYAAQKVNELRRKAGR